MLHVDHCSSASNLARIWVIIVPLAEDKSQAVTVVPHAGSLIYGIIKDLLPLRDKFDQYVRDCCPKLCAYFPDKPSVAKMQTTAWGYLVDKYVDAYDFPSKFTVLELRIEGFILTLNGLMVHGGHWREESATGPVFRFHVEQHLYS